MSYVFNPFTKKLDNAGTPPDLSGLVKLDQTTPQTVTGGRPILIQGIDLVNANSGFRMNADGITLELWLHGSLKQSWTTVIPVTGNPIGMLLSLTYA